MAHLHYRIRTRIWTRTQVRNPMARLCYTETVPIVQMQTQIPTPYFGTGYESKSESVPESVSGNVNEP